MTTSNLELGRPTRRWSLRSHLAVAGCALLLAIAGAGSAAAVDGGITVTSSDMSDGAAINPMFACTMVVGGPTAPDGVTSPQLSWSGAPAGTVSYVVLMHDETGANQGYDGGEWSHWAAYNISATSLVRDASATAALGGGTHAINTWGESGIAGENRYNGPCPPSGNHTYYFTVYALDATIAPTGTGMGGAVTTSDMLAAMATHILDQGDLQVTFDNAAVGTFRADIELSTATASDVEATGGNLPVLLVNGIVDVATTVTVSATGGTATGGTDYAFTSPQVVTIPAGTYDGTAATAIAIPTLAITDDTADEPDETIALTLSAATGNAVLSDANHDGTAIALHTYSITDDDAATVPPPVVNPPAVNAPAVLAATGADTPWLAVVVAFGSLVIGILLFAVASACFRGDSAPLRGRGDGARRLDREIVAQIGDNFAVRSRHAHRRARTG